MSNVQPVPKGYKPPQNQFSKWTAGEYYMRGIKWYSVEKTSQMPILVNTKSGNRRVGKVRFILHDAPDPEKATAGPVHFYEIGEMAMLAYAFDPAGIEQLPPVPDDSDAGAVSQYMIQIANIINNSGKVVKFVIGEKGFVSYVEGALIPDDLCTFRIIKVTSKLIGPDEKKTQIVGFHRQPWKNGGYSDQIHLVLQYIGDMTGEPTSFTGAQFFVRVPYGFRYENGELGWTTDDGGNINTPAQQASALYTLTAPNMFDPFEPPDPSNIVPYWLQKMGGLPSGPIVGFVENKISDSGFQSIQIDWTKCKPVDIQLPATLPQVRAVGVTAPTSSPPPTPQFQQPPPPSPPPPAPAAQQPVQSAPAPTPQVESAPQAPVYGPPADSIDTKARQRIGDMLSVYADGAVTMQSNGELTADGKRTAKAVLGPLAREGKIPQIKLASASYAECDTLAKGILNNEPKDGDRYIALAKVYEDLMSLVVQTNEPASLADLAQEDEDDVW